VYQSATNVVHFLVAKCGRKVCESKGSVVMMVGKEQHMCIQNVDKQSVRQVWKSVKKESEQPLYSNEGVGKNVKCTYKEEWQGCSQSVHKCRKSVGGVYQRPARSAGKVYKKYTQSVAKKCTKGVDKV